MASLKNLRKTKENRAITRLPTDLCHIMKYVNLKIKKTGQQNGSLKVKATTCSKMTIGLAMMI